MYLVFGLSATTQERLSTAQGAEYTLLNVIGVELYILTQTPLVRYRCSGIIFQLWTFEIDQIDGGLKPP